LGQQERSGGELAKSGKGAGFLHVFLLIKLNVSKLTQTEWFHWPALGIDAPIYKIDV
jgi:hypothetical protein